MNRKVLTTIQIVLAVIVLAYWVLPDFMLGPLDDGVIAALAFIAEIVLFVIRTLVISNTIRITDIQTALIISRIIRVTDLVNILTIKMMNSSFLQDVLIGSKLNHDIGI